MNKIILSGNLTRNPELRETATGKTLARFGIAVNRQFDRKTSDFFDVTAWGAQAEFCSNYLKKGQRVIVVGRMETNSYDKDGARHIAYNVVAEQIEFADSKRDNSDDDDANPPF